MARLTPLPDAQNRRKTTSQNTITRLLRGGISGEGNIAKGTLSGLAKLLQLTPRTEVTLPRLARRETEEELDDTLLGTVEERALLGRRVYNSLIRPGVSIATSLPAEMTRSYGRSLERLTTPEGALELISTPQRLARGTTDIASRVGKEPALDIIGRALGSTLTDPTTQTALDVSDFLPGIGFIGMAGSELAERSLIEGAERVSRELAEEAAERSGIEASEEALERAGRFAARELTEEAVEREGLDVAQESARQAAERFLREDLEIAGREGLEEVTERSAAEAGERVARETAEQSDQLAFDFSDIPRQAESPISRRAVAEGAEEAIERPQFTLESLDISDEARESLEDVFQTIRTDLAESGESAPIVEDRIRELASISEEFRSGISREQRENLLGRLAASREELARIGERLADGTATREETLKAFDLGLATSQRVTSAAQQLRSQQVELTARQDNILLDILRRFDDAGVDLERAREAAADVDFSDARQVRNYYRQFVKPTLPEILQEYRYINLLSSPTTQLLNLASNIGQGTVLRPATKLTHGGIDWIASTLTGSDREAYVREVGAYAKGFLNSFGEANKNLFDVLEGKNLVGRPDIERISTGKFEFGPMVKAGGREISVSPSLVLRAMEGFDVWLRTIIKNAELESLAYRATRQNKQLDQKLLGKLENQATETAKELIFRKELDPTGKKTGQGYLLRVFDQATSAVYSLRNRDDAVGSLVSWYIPFVKTPTEILKQGVEYSPLGFLTIPGASNKKEQLAKALVGTGTFLGAAWIAAKGDSTWAPPTGEKQKSLFYATKQPYSLKIGNQWVSYTRIGPLAYPIAMAAAFKWHAEQSPGAELNNGIEKITKTVASIATFFSDQSYVQGMNDIITLLNDPTRGAVDVVTNVPRQLVPMSSLLGFVARTVDPIYRNPESSVDNIMESLYENIAVGIPGLSRTVEPYKDPTGEPSRRPFAPDKLFSPQTLLYVFQQTNPLKIRPGDDFYEKIFQQDQFKRKINKIKRELRDGDITNREAMNAITKIMENERRKELPTGSLRDSGALPNTSTNRNTYTGEGRLAPIR